MNYEKENVKTILKPKKNQSVETLRGIAIILVVIGHVIGSDSTGGMRVADDSFLRHFYYTFQYLRMPLFTVISGWVYALRPVNVGYGTDFMIKKLRRIVLPLIFVGGLYYLVQNITPGTNLSYDLKDIWKIVVFPYTFYWYLHSLFVVFIVVSLIDTNRWAQKFSHLALSFGLSMLLLLLRDRFLPESWPNYFGYKGAIYLLPFFIIGIALQRFKEKFNNRYFLISMAVLLGVGMVFQQLNWYNLIDYNFSSRSGLGLLIGVVGTIFLLQINFSFKFLVWMGSFAFPIYLFHSFGTSGGRIVLKAVGIESTFLIFTGSLFLGLFLPIALEFIFDKFGLTRMLFIGRSFKK